MAGWGGACWPGCCWLVGAAAGQAGSEQQRAADAVCFLLGLW
eukprot:COSAG01_NODE_2749_length_7147_cov_21.077185_2_plen_42_part_00